jgi:tRNA(fMet)-specific endonuclease VapC
MLRYMLDTDTCANVLRGRHSALKTRFDRSENEICISSITLAELCYGAENSARPEANLVVLTSFVARLSVLLFSRDAAAHYGQIRARLKRLGQLTGYHDMLIGAHALSEDMTLVTNNRRDFDRMTGLRVENWVE